MRAGKDFTHNELCPVVLRAHVYPAEEQAYGDGTRVQEHAREERGVLVCFDDQEVAFYIARSENEVCCVEQRISGCGEHEEAAAYTSIRP